MWSEIHLASSSHWFTLAPMMFIALTDLLSPTMTLLIQVRSESLFTTWEETTVTIDGNVFTKQLWPNLRTTNFRYMRSYISVINRANARALGFPITHLDLLEFCRTFIILI